ncbi:MAG: hypothetical protein LH479_07320 [Polaromonas sp.]|nr:hypothetical protein [Polaromonas sp.]
MPAPQALHGLQNAIVAVGLQSRARRMQVARATDELMPDAPTPARSTFLHRAILGCAGQLHADVANGNRPTDGCRLPAKRPHPFGQCVPDSLEPQWRDTTNHGERNALNPPEADPLDSRRGLAGRLRRSWRGGGDNTAPAAPTDTSKAVSICQPPQAAIAQPGAAGDLATDAVNWMNFRRAQLGLSALASNAALARAAVAHANYVALNDSYLEGHGETAGKPGFTGSDVSARLASVGYLARPTSENMTYLMFNYGAEKTDGLIDAHYHRSTQLGDFLEVGGGGSFLARSAARAQDAYHYVADFGGKSPSWVPTINQLRCCPPPASKMCRPAGWHLNFPTRFRTWPGSSSVIRSACNRPLAARWWFQPSR